jgi:hypothetical protein
LQGRIGAIPLNTAIPTLPTVTVIRIMAPITPAIPTGAFEQLTGDIPDIGAFVGHIGAAAGACAEPTGVVGAGREKAVGPPCEESFCRWQRRRTEIAGLIPHS